MSCSVTPSATSRDLKNINSNKWRDAAAACPTARNSSERYLVDEPSLLQLTAELGGQLADPLKTTIVLNQRCMTAWIIYY